MDVIGEKPHLFLGSRLKRLAEQMQADVALVGQRMGIAIPPGQHALLVTLDDHGSKTIGELAQAMKMSQPAITKNVRRLAEAGLVAIGRKDADRRQSTVALSPVGRDALERSRRDVFPLVEAAVREVVDDLSGPLLEQIAAIEGRLAARSLSARAQSPASPRLEAAADADVPTVVALMNLAYRGVAAGWATEAGYIGGDRTSEALVRSDMAAKPDGALLVWRVTGEIRGCVWLEASSEHGWYLGSLTVDPRLQNAGFGRQLLAASEDWVRLRGGRVITMTVVNVRDKLIAWYARRGYHPTGETEPFPYGDARFGIPKRDDLHFIVLRKPLS